VLRWKTISPSAQVTVDPKIGARAIIRDTRAVAGRFLWSDLTGDEMYPVAEGRTNDRALDQSIAEAALHAFAENRVSGACFPTNFQPPASTLLDDALRMTERAGRAGSQPSPNRHKGQLLLRRAHPEAAEELYRKALSIAAEQEAKLWALRAVTSIARLCRTQGRLAYARDLLAPVYDWFTEGFDTPDLKEAKALLGPLA
jgi:hypothetical protein